MDRVDYQSVVIQDILNLHKKNELNLAPWYQRRSVWTTPQKSYLINTLFESKPIPALYFRHSIDLELEKSIREVVDGQQRTRAIVEYCNNDFSARHPNYIKKIKFSELKAVEKQSFLLTAIPVGYLLGASDADVIDIFGRINSVSKNLNAQEKRNAEFSGEFKQFCLRNSTTRLPLWRSLGVFTANDIARMTEVQFISDLVVNMCEGLSDFSPTLLHKYYKENDENFENSESIQKKLNLLFDSVGEMNFSKIKESIFVRQPIFFSFLMKIDQLSFYDSKKIQSIVLEIDRRFNAPENQTEEDRNFVNASTSSTQRLSQRKIRDKYIEKFLV